MTQDSASHRSSSNAHPSHTSQPTIYQRITDQIIAAIEAGAGNWKMPWHTDGTDITQPINAASGKAYRGINVIALWATARACGYTGGHWATYQQWKEIGAQVRQGEKSAPVVFWKPLGCKAEETEEPTESDRLRFVARGYLVFNAAQVDGYEAPTALTLPPAVRIGRAEEFFSNVGVEVRHGGSRAYFQPSTDHIQMPPFGAFREATGYYATLGHEATHWTGAKGRLDRDLSGRFGSEGYAAEELVAELGAAFLCGSLGLANEPRPDHAAYVASWLKVLRSDNRAIFTAAAKAQQAADCLHSLQQSAAKPPAQGAQDKAAQVKIAALLPQQFQMILPHIYDHV